MPRSVREGMLRELTRAVNNIDWAGTHLATVIKEYEADHNEISEPLRELCGLLQEAQNLIMGVRRRI